MAKQQLGFVVPTTLAVALNAATPDPGGVSARGCVIWSTTTLSLLQWDGAKWIPDLAGPGLQFPATQVPSADVNTLDDYEEGTWTPSMLMNAVDTGNVYSARTAWYVKIGKLVIGGFNATYSTKGSGVGVVSIGGLPFVVAAVGIGGFNTCVILCGGGGSTMPALSASFPNPLTSTINIRSQSATGLASISNTNMTATTQLAGSFAYIIS